MALDIYSEAEIVIEALGRQGLGADGEALRDAIRAGSTSTEILMAMRWHLRHLSGSPHSVDDDTKRRIRSLLLELDRILA